jgi:hypothetical protein
VESTLRFILEAEVFVAADLPGDLDDAGKLVLLQRLLREGFLTLCESTDARRAASGNRG